MTTVSNTTLADKNQAYWKPVNPEICPRILHGAAKSVFKYKWVHDLQKQISDFLASNVDWIGIQSPSNNTERQTKLMDYACGNGIVSMSLYHLFSKCIEIDLSDGMLDKYRATAATLGLPESRMMAVQGNLLAPMVQPTNSPLDDEELDGFDLVAISLGVETTSRWRFFLIIDWATRDSLAMNEHASPDAVHPKHAAAHTISHDSFTQEQIVNLYEQAGCGDVRFVLADRLSDVPGARSGKMQLFWARATKL
ncbi:hypothetical protein AARAC_010564 [Aspergillus arachidicola]|uniref:Methyltransferase domain-containing protein n=1 Tax=Aspergillus arachidicola TaxID=656916 RepID=A0A2G7FMI0_9EURO|nr:hypothetical protein AARAC_010564 [Aspergillus arachidicola]